MYEALKELMADEFDDVRQEESQESLKALIDILKGVLPDFDSAYQRIIKNEKYADVSREQAMQYWQ